jgi:hypothetical protein
MLAKPLATRAKCTPIRYKVTLRTDAGWDGTGYCCSFDTRAGEWQTVDLPFKGFFPVFRCAPIGIFSNTRKAKRARRFPASR